MPNRIDKKHLKERVTDYGNNKWEKTEYDEQGNLTYHENSDGVWESGMRSFCEDNSTIPRHSKMAG